jgi:AcrR family transcriptional regulator
MPKRSPEYMRQQRLRFCEAAMAGFRRKGVGATSLTDICEESGLSMGALYKHFASRDELLEAVLQLRLEQRNAMLHGATWPDLRGAILRLREDSDHSPFWREFMALADLNEKMRDLRIHEAGVILSQIEQQLRRYVEAGEIQPAFPPRQTAQLISIIFDGSLIEVRRAPRLSVSLDELASYLDHAAGARPAFRSAA